MRLSRNLLILPLLFVLPASLLAQDRSADWWYFGDRAGLLFSGGSPTVLSDGQLSTLDGSAVASNRQTGALRFYTDGITVWTANHTPMINGTGLRGHQSSGQPALVVPSPGNDDTYYVFTTGAAGNSATYHYSVVDMTEQGGLGAVTLKNQELLARGSEKQGATRHCNGRDYWVVTHEWGSNSFFSFLVTPDGIVDTVVSAVGTTYPTNQDIQGTIQFSPDGGTVVVTAPALQQIELFSFDRLTGVLSNPRILDQGLNFYGAEFSPDFSRLYIATLARGNDTDYLFQYDLTRPDLASVRSSRVQLHEENGTWDGAGLQLGPDGKIYVSWFSRDFLSVIDQPNELGVAAGYRHDAIDLSPGRTQYGLPNFIDSDLTGVARRFAAPSLASLVPLDTVTVGDRIVLRFVICNQADRELQNVELQANGGGLSATRTVSSIPVNGCDTVLVDLGELTDGSRDSVRICASLTGYEIESKSFPGACAIQEEACLTVSVLDPHEPQEVDYTFHFVPACVGQTTLADVFFNSRRYTDTIVAISFFGPDGSLFEYPGPRPVRIPITPTSDQRIPVRFRRSTVGPVEALMHLVTSSNDLFVVRLKTSNLPARSPFLNRDSVGLAGAIGFQRHCFTVTNQHGATVIVTDTVWERTQYGGRLISPALPFEISPGQARELCVEFSSIDDGIDAELVLGGMEGVEFCPYCMTHAFHFHAGSSVISPPVSGVTEDVVESLSLAIRPQPAANRLVFAVSGVDHGTSIDWELLDNAGRSLMGTSTPGVRQAGEVSVDVSGVAAGMYHLKVVTGQKEILVRQIVIRR